MILLKIFTIYYLFVTLFTEIYFFRFSDYMRDKHPIYTYFTDKQICLYLALFEWFLFPYDLWVQRKQLDWRDFTSALISADLTALISYLFVL